MTNQNFTLPSEIKLSWWQAWHIRKILKKNFSCQLLYTCQQKKKHLLQFHYSENVAERYSESPGISQGRVKLPTISEEIEMQPINRNLYPTLEEVQTAN